jgi:hypothetical protein
MVYIESAMTGAGIILDGASNLTGSLLGLDTATITSIVTLFGIVAAAIYTYRKEKNSSLTGYRTYEKDVQEQMSKDIDKLRERAEKYAMLRLKLLETPGIDGEKLIKEIEQEYKEFGG